MGRSRSETQQLPSQSSSVASRPKDYSKHNLLRKISVKQKSSSTQLSPNPKLNAVMQMDPPGSRRRLGRNPIAETQPDFPSDPTDADSSNEAGPGGSNSNSAECRRSSRKKTIKFDVRDLLNKNRKCHKIQIEARIDSNEPKIGAGQISKAELDSKQKNFIEKSAIFRRYSISENKLPPRPPPPPGALIHTIQQCVGELEQLPLDGGELNLAAISPIARRLSRTQDILTASMIKPKQVSSLIVTKLESASTSKAPPVQASAIPTRRSLLNICEPSTSTAVQQKQQKRGRKTKAKIFVESTTESSSNDSFDLPANTKRTSGEKVKFKEDLNIIGRKVNTLAESSTTGIDLKENLDASAVTLPHPIILSDCVNNSTDESSVGAEEIVFRSRNHSSDESSTSSLLNSPTGRQIDEISLFGRSNSTETNSSDDSEKRRRKIRIAVKRVSLTPQKSPIGSSFGLTTQPIQGLASIIDESSNEDEAINESKPTTKPLKEKQVESCATPPIIVIESDTSNAASIGSSVIEVPICSEASADQPDPFANTRKGRSCKLIEEVFSKISTPDRNFKGFKKSTVPQNAEVSLRNRSSSRKLATQLSIETIAAGSPFQGQSMEEGPISLNESDGKLVENENMSLSQTPQTAPITSIKENQIQTEETYPQTNSEEQVTPKLRSLRSTQSASIKSTTLTTSKRQKKIIKTRESPDTAIEHDVPAQTDQEVLPKLSTNSQLESVSVVHSQELGLTLSEEKQNSSLKQSTTSDSNSLQTQLGVKQQSISDHKDALAKPEGKQQSQSDEKEQVVSSKHTQSKDLNKKEKIDDGKLPDDKIIAKDSTLSPEEQKASATDKKTKETDVEEEDSKSERESTDRSSTDTTFSDGRRESPRLRSSVLSTQNTAPKKISKVSAKSSTTDSSSETSESPPEKSPKQRRKIKPANLADDKSKDETSSLCSDSSSNASSSSSPSSTTGSSSTSSTSSSSSASSSSSSSSSVSSSSSSSSEGRSAHSSRSTQKALVEKLPQEETIRNKSPTTPENNFKKQSTGSDSECSETFSKTDSIKEKYNDMKFNELEKLMKRRKSARLERWSSEHESESSDGIQYASKTRSGRSRGRAEREEVRQKLHTKTSQQKLGACEADINNTAIKDKTDESTINQESNPEDAQKENSVSPRAKSKKRTRRFVPIKYSSSESGTLSDDGNHPSKNSSVRLTRTRRKTISSASDFEDMPSANLSPPDVALEYVPRKQKQAQAKTQELLINSKKLEVESPQNYRYTISRSKTEGDLPQEAISKIVKLRKATGNASKSPSGTQKEDSSDSSKESDSGSCKDVGSKQEVHQLEPASPTSSCDSPSERRVDVYKERKVTRLFLKTRNNESLSKVNDVESSQDIKDRDMESTESQLPDKSVTEESQPEIDLKNDNGNKSTTQDSEDPNCMSEEYCSQNKDHLSISHDVVVNSVGVSQSKFTKQRKNTKSSQKSLINLRSKEEEDGDNEKSKETQDDFSTKTESLNRNVDNSPISRKPTRSTPKSTNSDIVSGTEIEFHDLFHDNILETDTNNDAIQEVVVTEDDNNSKLTALAKWSPTRKATRQSTKLMETNDSEHISEEKLENVEKKTDPQSIPPINVSKSDEVMKTPKQRKPTRFSPRSPENAKLQNDQQTKEDSTKNYESAGQKEPDLSSPSSVRLPTRSVAKTLDLKQIEYIQRDENEPTEPQPDAFTEESTDTLEKSKILETIAPIVPESDNSKLTETPKRKRKPTRFSPKSPDKPSNEVKENLIESEPILKDLPCDTLDKAPNDQIELKKPDESTNLSTTSAEFQPEGLVKNLRGRKGTRFTAKNADNLQIQQQDLMKIKESPTSTQVENNEITQSAHEIPDVICSSFETTELKDSAKLTRSRKGTRLLENTSDNIQTKEELKKTLDDSQTAINIVLEKTDIPAENIQQQETIKATRTKKCTRFSVQDSSMNEEITKAAENESFVKDSSNIPTTLSIQTENDPKQPTRLQHSENISQESTESMKDLVGLSNSAPIKETIAQEELIELADLNATELSSPPIPTLKPEITSKKGLKKQLQSMLDSLKSEGKVASPKETTPRRKRKNLAQQQETGIFPLQESPTPNKTDDVDMKALSPDPNLSDDSTKPHQGTIKTNTPRRQLDSSFIESLEKSLLRPNSTKKSSKKKEKEKETIVLQSPKTPKEESKKSTPKKFQEPLEELKKSENSSSPKVKKKQTKESPKMDKKHSEEQTMLKRKSMTAKAKELAERKPLDTESRISNMLKEDSTTKQSSHQTAVVLNQLPKTKAESKFFPGEKPLILDGPSSPIATIVKEPSVPSVIVKEQSPDLLPDPLKDIAKFIEDGVNLLKRGYKIDDDASLDRDILKADGMMTPKKCKLDESIPERKSEATSPDDENSNSNSESSTMTTNTSTSEVDTPNGIRRSHRIKNSKSTKCLVGRGLVRERERFSTKDDEKTVYSIDDQKMDLAEVEAKNSKFLKDMEERLSNFRVIRENEYKCDRVISKEAKRMLCDCFLTREEEERGELGCGEDCLNRLLMIECGSDCTVRERCTNRRFNKFLYSPCRVFRTEKKGFGIMADIEILPGEFIMEYVGEVINGNEFEIRINEYSKDKNKHYYFMALRSDAVIDATAKGNISRFINHSCDPNAETQKWTVNGELRIGFFSRKSIMPGEEITFDYQYQRYGKEAQKCYCESANCRGWIGAEPSSEEEEEEEYEESEEYEEEEPAEAVVPVPVIPSPVPPISTPVAEEQPLVHVVATEVPALDVKIVPPLQPIAAQTPLAEPIPMDVPTIPKELPIKKKKEKKRLLEEKLKRREPKQFLEDPDIEDEVRFLVKCGLRNQADTLRLSRLIVRAKLLETRIKLLQILRQGELPCRRLFLDYHGLRLLHGWMSEVIDSRDTEKGMEIRMELLSALECLPISNKTMLTDSKVYQTVRDWSNNKESHSPSDQSPKETNANTSVGSPTTSAPMTVTEDASSELQKLATKLVHTWDNLPEVFRIPKRERIEQMKEHEREADRQYKVLGKGFTPGSDRKNNRERFMSKSGKKGRFKWPKEKERERANDRRKYAQNNSSGKDTSDKSTGCPAGESHLSKEQRRELFAAKVARDEAEKRQAEERREFDIKCRFFGLDPKRMRPENMPFCVNPSTGQWYSTDKKKISTPPSYAHVQVPVKPKSTNPEDYRLPEMDLPPMWKFAISPKGKIYYYHVKIRIPQWEPPIKILPLAGQRDTDVKNSESDSSTTCINDSSEDDIDIIKGFDPVKLQAYIEKKIEDLRLQRYTRLVVEKPISPRKEEDRLYNQMEVRKYKENKEKIRKRKEEIRKRRDIIGMPETPLESSSLSETTAVSENVADVLPIQDYLLSSEEEEIIKAECNNSPLIDKIVQGDKIVDELDALHRKRALKRAQPIRDKYEHKKRKMDKNKDLSKSTKRNKDGEGGSSTSSSKYRKVREKFRCEIAGIIVQHLKPYRNESCFTGKIMTDDDFNHLARKLTHFVMVKELKYCESIGQTLIVTESVKNKSREFIKKYMAKYGKVYVRPRNDPEFKDIPFL